MNAWRQTVERMGLRIPPGTGGFVRWWQLSLLAWLPPRWQSQLGFAPSRLLLARDGEVLRLARAPQREQLPEPLSDLPWPLTPQELDRLLPSRLQALPRHWLLPAPLALRRALRLPVAAAARLQDVARFEIDRQTPFEAEQVWYDMRLRASREDDQLDAELVVVPRRALDGEQGVPMGWRGQLAGVDVADAEGRPLGINLLPAAMRQSQADPAGRWNLLLLAIALVAVAVAGRLLLDNRSAAADSLQAQVQASAQQARAVAMQRQQLVELIEGAAFFEQQRAARPSAIEVWNELSRRLPDGTYLEKFSMEGDELQLIGLSSEASSLVERLEGAPTWRTPSLSGVLQSDAGQGRDRFTMTATLAPATVPPSIPGAPK
ncbi:MAG TPA: PilN domain-containing protein [Stenotrophomonas sp.]|jgi:general secretion pathway protein L